MKNKGKKEGERKGKEKFGTASCAHLAASEAVRHKESTSQCNMILPFMSSAFTRSEHCAVPHFMH